MERVVLLADKKAQSWDFALKIQNYLKQKRDISIPLEEVSINHFRDKEIDMHVPKNIRKRQAYFIQDSTKNPQEWWVELHLIKDLLLSSSAESVSFVLPDLLYSRKDRKEKSRVPISARALANSLSPGTKRIITMDLHASQIQGFYPATTPLDNLYSFPEVTRYLVANHSNDLENLVVISPDAGGAERAKAFLHKLEERKKDLSRNQNYSFALISKTRPEAGEIETMELVGNVRNKNVLIIDDIIDSGNTLCTAAQLLKENKAKKLMFYATHGLFTEGTKKLFQNFGFLMTSNTHYRKNDKVEIIDVSSVFAEAIYRAEKGLSISKLFE